MDLTTLLRQIGRPCTAFDVGGFRPTNDIEESWLGRVTHYAADETTPTDKHGEPMLELGQFYLPAMPFVPASLAGTTLLTAFISPNLEGDSDLMDGCWEIREYRSHACLVRRSSEKTATGLKPLPLRSYLVDADHPVWDGGGLTAEQEDAFIALEREGAIANYFDVTSRVYGHKFGGYPSFCQPGVDLHPFEFVFQVSSDPKIQLNVIDNGSLTFWRHPELGTWKLYYDFY